MKTSVNLLEALNSIIEWTDNETTNIPLDRLVMLIRNCARTAIMDATYIDSQ